LDLVFFHSGGFSSKGLQSKGNIEGEIPHHHYRNLFNDEIFQILNDKIDVFLEKLYKHAENFQQNKYSNYFLIYNAFWSLIDFTNILLFEKYPPGEVKPQDWKKLRECLEKILIRIIHCIDTTFDEDGYLFQFADTEIAPGQTLREICKKVNGTKLLRTGLLIGLALLKKARKITQIYIFLKTTTERYRLNYFQTILT